MRKKALTGKETAQSAALTRRGHTLGLRRPRQGVAREARGSEPPETLQRFTERNEIHPLLQFWEKARVGA